MRYLFGVDVEARGRCVTSLGRCGARGGVIYCMYICCLLCACLCVCVSLSLLYLSLFCVWSCFRDTLNVVDELKATVGSLEREDGMGSIKVEVMDPNVAEIYAKSPRSHVSWGCSKQVE